MVGMTTKELLTDLGERAIRAHGFGGFSYADLARDAGIRKASIHHHFPSKADLGLAVLVRYSDRLEERLATVQRECSTAAEAMRGAVDIYRAALGDGNSLCLCAALAGDGVQSSAEILEQLAATNSMVVDWFKAVLSAGASDGTIRDIGDIDDEASALLAQLQGAQLLARAGSDVALFDSATAALTQRLSA